MVAGTRLDFVPHVLAPPPPAVCIRPLRTKKLESMHHPGLAASCALPDPFGSFGARGLTCLGESGLRL
jgi:hypothetical protein